MHLAVNQIISTLIIPCITMKAGALIEWELSPVDSQKTILPFFAGLHCNELLCLFLIVGTRKMYSLIMEGKEGNDNMVSALLNTTY